MSLLLTLACSETFGPIWREPQRSLDSEAAVEADADSDADADADTDSDADTDRPVGLADLFSGGAELALDSEGPFGGDFAMHFPSVWWHEGTLHAWYIENFVDGVGRSRVGLATSVDGVYFDNQGTVLDVGGGWQWTWDADELNHNVGAAEAGGWSANTNVDPPGHMVFGPYVDDLPAGPMTVSFQLMVDNHTADSLAVVTLDVFDATSSQVLASRAVTRDEFGASWTYEVKNLDFELVAGHQLEFRVYWHDISYVRVGTIAVSQGQAPFHDERLASFPGVWREGERWFMVYESAGLTADWPGDLSLATSTDGRSWVKHRDNPLLTHRLSGYESVNIGTPSLYKRGGTWYLFFHGFDGDDVQIGLATGSDLLDLSKRSSPVLATSSDGWDSGTVGARSIIEQDGWFYMAYEGSTDPPYDSASWSTGVARSQDLISWEKCSCNPVLPQTGSGFGFDGPEWLELPDGRLALLYRGANNQTWRAILAWR